MIILTRLDGSQILLNSEFIEMVEKTPDTVVRLSDKKYFIVRENLEEIIDKVVEFKKRCVENTPLN